MKKDEQNKLTGNLAADELYPESLPDEYHVEIYIRLDPDENEYGFDAERHEHDYFKTLEEARAWAEKTRPRSCSARGRPQRAGYRFTRTSMIPNRRSGTRKTR